VARDIDARMDAPSAKPARCRRRGWRARLPAQLFLIAILSVAGTALAAPPTLEYQVKAAFLLSFVTYTEWPASVFEGASSPLRICVAGGDPFEGSLVRTMQGETAAGHPLVTKHLGSGEDVTGCHLLFVPRTADDRDAAIDRGTMGYPILVVGESEALWRHGAVISFAVDEGRVRFDVNRTAAQRRGLRLSSKLLRLARLVR
jgi:hypothetical protein